MRRVLVLLMAMMAAGICSAQGVRDINGSDVVFDSYIDLGPTDLQLNFTATQVTTSTEWFDQVTLTLPAAWTINSATSTDFDSTGGFGTNVATFSDSGYPCSGLGKDCGSGCVLVVHVNPNGVYSSQNITWMIEGDTYTSVGGSVICSPGDTCGYDVCYDGFGGSTVEGADIVTGPVPVELQTFSVE